MEGDDERDPRACRRPLRGAVQDVHAIASRLCRERAEVPADVSHRHERAAAAAEGVAAQLELRLGLEACEEPGDVTRHACPREDEWCDVETDPN